VKTKNKTADFEEDSTQEAVSATFVAGKPVARKPRTTGGSENSSGTRKTRSYNSEYLKFGFTTNGSVSPLSLRVICCETSSGHCMKPSLLKRHRNTKHSTLKDKSIEYFTRKCEGINIASAAVTVYAKSSQLALQASYEIAQMIAKTKKPHTIAETLVILASIRIAEIMLSEKEVVKIKNIPHSNDTIRRRIDEMAEDIIKEITEKIIQKKQFALQLDETKDISSCAQLMVFCQIH
jgi:hypothetical protein